GLAGDVDATRLSRPERGGRPATARELRDRSAWRRSTVAAGGPIGTGHAGEVLRTVARGLARRDAKTCAVAVAVVRAKRAIRAGLHMHITERGTKVENIHR